jgi:hypothetical protein
LRRPARPFLGRTQHRQQPTWTDDLGDRREQQLPRSPSASAKPEDDPVIGTAEDVIIGYYRKDGEYGDIVAGAGNTIAVTERDATGRPVTYRIEATDSLGRRLEATGRARNIRNWQGYSWLITFWSLIEWELDGQTAL